MLKQSWRLTEDLDLCAHPRCSLPQQWRSLWRNSPTHSGGADRRTLVPAQTYPFPKSAQRQTVLLKQHFRTQLPEPAPKSSCLELAMTNNSSLKHMHSQHSILSHPVWENKQNLISKRIFSGDSLGAALRFAGLLESGHDLFIFSSRRGSSICQFLEGV